MDWWKVPCHHLGWLCHYSNLSIILLIARHASAFSLDACWLVSPSVRPSLPDDAAPVHLQGLCKHAAKTHGSQGLLNPHTCCVFKPFGILLNAHRYIIMDK